MVDKAYHLDHQPLPAQTEVLGALNESIGTERDRRAGRRESMPGDLQMLWRAQDPKQYHVEYAFSCMGYEIAGALGIKMAAPEREVYSLVGDGSYLMMAQEIVTAVSEGIKLIIVIVQNHGFCLDRGAVGVAGVAAVRHLLPLPERRYRTARRRHAAGRSGVERRKPGRGRDPGEDHRRIPQGA